MPETNLKNIALLIDADNASHAGIDPVLTVLAELGQVNIRRAYGNWAKPALSNWNKITHRFGLQPMQQFDLTKGKNATDMKMTIDAMDLLFRGRVEGFGIMSSDSDFTRLAARIREQGVGWNIRVGDAVNEGFARAAGNLPNINVLPAVGANVYDILKHDTLVLTRAAVEKLEARFNG